MTSQMQPVQDDGSGFRVLKWIVLGVSAAIMIVFVYVAVISHYNFHSVALLGWFIGMAARVLVTAVLFWADTR